MQGGQILFGWRWFAWQFEDSCAEQLMRRKKRMMQYFAALLTKRDAKVLEEV